MENLRVFNSKPGQGLSSLLISLIEDSQSQGNAYISTLATEELARNSKVKYIFTAFDYEDLSRAIDAVSTMPEIKTVAIDRLTFKNQDELSKLTFKIGKSGKLWLVGQQISANGDLSLLNRFAGEKMIYENKKLAKI